MVKLRRRGDGTFASGLAARTEKHARHLARLCWQGLHAYATGEILIRLPDHEITRIRTFTQRVADGQIDVAEELLLAYQERFDATTSVLSDRPHEALVERWLLDVRAHFFERQDGYR